MAGVRRVFPSGRILFPIAVLCLDLAPFPSDAATITWTGNAGGSWHSPGSWDLNRAPGSGDDVVIPDLAGTTSVTYSSGATLLNSLICAENFALSGGQLFLAAASSISGAFNLFSAELAGNGDLSITGSFFWGASGVMNGTGVTTIAPGATWLANLSMFTGTNMTRVLENYGAGIKGGPGVFGIQGDGLVRNRSGGSFDLQGGSVSGAGAFENMAGATFLHSGGGGVALSCDFSNQGTVRVTGGTLGINGVFSNYASQTLTGGTYDLTGVLRFNGADVRTIAAAVILDGTASAILGDMAANGLANLSTIDAAGSLVVKTGRVLTTAQMLTNSGTVVIGPGGSSRVTANSGYRQVAGVTMLDGGTVASTSMVDIQGGSLRGTGTIFGNTTNSGEIAPGASAGTITVTGDYSQSSAGTLILEIGGFASGTQYDAVNVSGTASLDGTLLTSLINGFVPMPPDHFSIITASVRTGQFATAAPIQSGPNCLVVAYGSTFARLETQTCSTSDIPAQGAQSLFGITALSPNPLPAGHPLRVALAMPREQVVELELFDVAGRLLAVRRPDAIATSAEAEIHWNPGRLAAGHYFVRLRGALGAQGVRRFVVIH